MKVNRFYSCVAALALCSLARLATAQSWLGEVHVRSQFTYGTNTVNLRVGDKVVLDCRLSTDENNTAHVWTASGHAFDIGPSNGEVQITYTANSTSDVAYGRFTTFGEDGDDDEDEDADVRIGIMPRANLVATKPTVRGDGSVTYGYSVGDLPWDPRGNNVGVELYYARGTTPLGGPIASHSLLTQANSHGLFAVSKAQLPSPPSGTDGLVCIVDKSDVIPESNESDNVAQTPLTNLRVIAPTVDDRGTLHFGYEIQRTYAVTSNYVTLDLYYASGPSVSSILDTVPPIYSTTLNLAPSGPQNLEMKLGEYPLAPPEARYIVEVIDRHQVVTQGGPGTTDDSASVQASVAPGYTLYAYVPGIAVYKKSVNGIRLFATVVDLRHAAIGQMYLPTDYRALPEWWQAG